MSNTQIAIDWANQNIQRTKSGGVVAFAMFANATKHDVKTIEKSIKTNPAVSAVNINKKYAIINLK